MMAETSDPAPRSLLSDGDDAHRGDLSGHGSTATVQATLNDGSAVKIRELLREDLPALSAFLASLSLEARRLRFFSGGIDIARMADSVGATGPGRTGLLAFDEGGAVVGHAVCIEMGDGRAEVALEIADGLHGQGLGTILLERLAQLAEQRGVCLFVAQVLPENREMLDVFRDGFDAAVVWRDGVDFVEFPTSAWRLASGRFPPAREPSAQDHEPPGEHPSGARHRPGRADRRIRGRGKY